MRRLILQGKIIVFKTLAILKIVFLSLISKVPTVERIQKTFLWPYKPKIKNEKHGGLKNLYIKKKNNKSSMFIGGEGRMTILSMNAK